ncbi:aldo/keto reductase [Rhodococcus opacus]|uniref:Putative oxidoreductase n=1 Tax=Rhodococcus opacus (strain B4) TaxID=632772 RepID=C1B699_RHOOB|nr:aldo/keto reductase [Rhodococcus opacus]BAH51202.1 putative oxidoreductase [Rhodococcus opacus B4]
MTAAASTLLLLPGTDLHVSRLCLGGNRFGSALDESESFALLDTFAELGGNFVDTALVYADWVPGVERSCSEHTLGRWLTTRDCRKAMVVATKGGHPDLAHPAGPRLDRASLRADAHASAENLGGAPIDLYYLHRDDPSRPIGDILDTMETLVDESVIRYYAASNFSADRLAAAAQYASASGIGGFVANQLEWSLAAPKADRVAPDLTYMDAGLLEFHRTHRLPVVPYSAQAKGYFEKSRSAGPIPQSVERYDTARNARTAQLLHRLADEYETDATALALRALIDCEIDIVPVVGCRTGEQLRRSWSCLDVSLSPSDSELLTSLTLSH